MNGDLEIGLLPSILGLITLIIIIIGTFGIVVNFEAVYDQNVTNYSTVTDGLLTNSTTHQQVAATSGLIASMTPNMVWLLILFIVIAIIYGVYHLTKRRRGNLITRRRRL